VSLDHLVDFNNMTVDEWNEIHNLAVKIIKNPEEYTNICNNKILATLFYEPSTRTMMSFQTAMLRLGGKIIGFDNPQNSSVAKGETLKDTIMMVSSYADIIVMRNPKEGAAFAASLYSKKPIINAGDGGHFHPTQTMADLFTIIREKGTVSGLNIGVCGDLKLGRTTHSLLRALSMFSRNTYYLFSSPHFRMPTDIVDLLRNKGNTVYETINLEDNLGDLDVLYMTRIQKERIFDETLRNDMTNQNILTTEKLKKMKKDSIILHPLPRVDEIEEKVDYDPRAKYFEQAQNGLYVRMALIIKMLEHRENGIFIQKIEEFQNKKENHSLICPNQICITRTEKYLPILTYPIQGPRPGDACLYCDYRVN